MQIHLTNIDFFCMLLGYYTAAWYLGSFISFLIESAVDAYLTAKRLTRK